jgi:predicted  nucleic acid-binding Zn-ribbon protein
MDTENNLKEEIENLNEQILDLKKENNKIKEKLNEFFLQKTDYPL